MAYKGMDPKRYERDLLAMGADPEDAAAARRDLERQQKRDEKGKR